jgi:putative peptide zinc metalloprotease protein
VPQEYSSLLSQAADRVEIRVKGRPDMKLVGRKLPGLPAGKKELPSAALGYAAGGSMQIAADDPTGRKTVEPFFEVRIEVERNPKVLLKSGQRVVVRFDLPPKPLMQQWWRAILQLFQRRFQR